MDPTEIHGVVKKMLTIVFKVMYIYIYIYIYTYFFFQGGGGGGGGGRDDNFRRSKVHIHVFMSYNYVKRNWKTANCLKKTINIILDIVIPI